MAEPIADFLQHAAAAFHEGRLVKISLGGKRKTDDLKNVLVRPVQLKAGILLSFVYRHQTKDITKNHSFEEGAVLLQSLLQEDFFNADMYTASHTYHLLQNKKGAGKLIRKAAAAEPALQQHDRPKQRILSTKGKIYLQQLGICTADGQVKKDMQDKYRQINHYIGIIEGIIKDVQWNDAISVADMGSGKGYLTFALYDYLVHTLHLNTTMLGVEMRPDLIETCNRIAKAASFNQLQFIQGAIADAAIPPTDMLIALHACDTATDDAIYKGITNNSKVIICAPCCHKQIRKQMRPTNALSSITRHGILLEREAEIVTDSIRALLLESAGYSTKVFEFISTEHTPKNVMIAAVKNATHTDSRSKECMEKVQALKGLFNIETHYLETLMKGRSF